MTLAPPPATIVQILPFGFRTVNLSDALVCNLDNFNKVLAERANFTFNDQRLDYRKTNSVLDSSKRFTTERKGKK